MVERGERKRTAAEVSKTAFRMQETPVLQGFLSYRAPSCSVRAALRLCRAPGPVAVPLDVGRADLRYRFGGGRSALAGCTYLRSRFGGERPALIGRADLRPRFGGRVQHGIGVAMPSHPLIVLGA